MEVAEIRGAVRTIQEVEPTEHDNKLDVRGERRRKQQSCPDCYKGNWEDGGHRKGQTQGCGNTQQTDTWG